MNVKKLEQYGAENIGQLRKVMLHCPEQSIRRIMETNQGFYLFDKIPDYDLYINEHKAYGKLLSDNGVEVYELSNLIVNNRELMTYLPNLFP